MDLSFTSIDFIVVLAICVGLLTITRTVSAKKWLLIAVSCLFYLTFGVVGLSVLSLTAVVDFNVGRHLARAVDAGTRKRWLWVSLAVNLGALTLFKSVPLVAIVAKSALWPLGLRTVAPAAESVVPVGLSYFTFAGMSYVLDVYYERMTASLSFPEYFCYLVYFPKIVAGPIVRASQFLPDFRRGRRLTAGDIETGCAYFLVGAIQKLVIADQLAKHVSMILAAPQQYDGFTLLQGIVGYTVQLYCDFSGYSNMAIGSARLMGVTFPQNFLMPYSAVNIAEFWRRWHVTLSTWLRDYVFLPLELGRRGTRNATLRGSVNILITMVLCGLWHGTGWNFILWGGLHGVALAVYQWRSALRTKVAVRARPTVGVSAVPSWALTLSVVMVGWIVFGTQTPGLAVEYIRKIITWSHDGVALGSPYIWPLTAVVVIVHVCISKDRNLIEEVPSYRVPIRVLAYTSGLLALAALVPANGLPFVYVQF